jgi:hypothetical protein
MLQRTLLDSVHLPNFVRPLGTLARRSGFASRRCGRLPAGAKVSLQSSRAGQRHVSMQLLQTKQDVRRAPGWMLLVQQQRLLQRPRRCRRLGLTIRCLQRRLTPFAKLLTKSPHGAARKMKFISNVRRLAALLQTRPYSSPQR